MSNENKVVRYLRQLNIHSEFDPVTYLGIEQRFVNSIKHSGIRNFEEQYILGINTIIESYINDDGHKIQTKFFCKDKDRSVNYYKIISEIYEEGFEVYDNLFFTKRDIKFSNDVNDIVTFGTGVNPFENEEGLYCIDNNIFIEDNSLKFSPSFQILQKDILYYVDENNESNALFIKTLIKEKDENENIIVKEIIQKVDNE